MQLGEKKLLAQSEWDQNVKHDKTCVYCGLGDSTRYVAVWEFLHTINVHSQ
jgi:hypothetical protein